MVCKFPRGTMPFRGKKSGPKHHSKLGRPTIVNDYKKYLKLLKSSSTSYLSKVHHHVHVCLLPEYFNKKQEALDLLLTAKLGMYSTELQGFQMAYNPKNITFKENMGVAIGIQPVIHYDVSTDFIIFTPKPEAVLEAVVNKKSEYLVGCLVHGRFYVAMHDCDDKQNKTWFNEIEYGDKILVKITKIEENHSGYVSLIGSYMKKLENAAQHGDNVADDSGVFLEDENKVSLNSKITFDEIQQTTTTIEEIQPVKKKKKSSKKRKHEQESLTSDVIPCKIVKVKKEPYDAEVEMRLKQSESMKSNDTSFDESLHKKHKKSKKHKKIKIKQEPIDTGYEDINKSELAQHNGHHLEESLQANNSSAETPRKEHKHKKKKKEKKMKIKEERDAV